MIVDQGKANYLVQEFLQSMAVQEKEVQSAKQIKNFLLEQGLVDDEISQKFWIQL